MATCNDTGMKRRLVALAHERRPVAPPCGEHCAHNGIWLAMHVQQKWPLCGVREDNPRFIQCRLPGRGGKRSETGPRSEEHTSELQSLMRISYAVFCLKKKNKKTN